MILAAMLGLALLLLLPLCFAFRKAGDPLGRRETAMAIHAAQLGELERDLRAGRIGAAEHGPAKLEIERRLLAADRLRDRPADGNARYLLPATVLLLPAIAFLLYLPGSTPDVPSEPHAQWVVQQHSAHLQAQTLIAALRARLATLDPDSVAASQGQAYLAEALAEDAGALTPESIALFERSLRHAPDDASWRRLDEARLAEIEPGQQ